MKPPQGSASRRCPTCGCGWVALDDAEPTACPTCRFERPPLSTLYDGQPREEREAEPALIEERAS